MEQDKRNGGPPEKPPGGRIIIRSPVSLAIFAIAILAVAAAALALIAESAPLAR